MALQAFNLVFIATDDRLIAGGHDPVENALNFFLQPEKLPFARCDNVFCLRASCVPDVAEHGLGEPHQTLRRLQGFDDVPHFGFQCVARDGLAIGLTGFRLTEVICVALPAAGAPGRAQGRSARAADHRTAQNKVIADIGALGGIGGACTAFLHFLEELQRDERLVLRLEPVNAVMFGTDVAGIDRMAKEVGDALLDNLAFLVAWEFGEGCTKAGDFGLGCKAAGGISLKSLADNRGQGLIGKEHFPAPFYRSVHIANRRIMYPITVLHTRFGFLPCLARILLTLKLTLGGKDRLHELTLGRVIEAVIQAFEFGFAVAEGLAQFKMEVTVAGKAFEIVKDDDELFVRMGIHKGQ